MTYAARQEAPREQLPRIIPACWGAWVLYAIALGLAAFQFSRIDLGNQFVRVLTRDDPSVQMMVHSVLSQWPEEVEIVGSINGMVALTTKDEMDLSSYGGWMGAIMGLKKH